MVAHVGDPGGFGESSVEILSLPTMSFLRYKTGTDKLRRFMPLIYYLKLLIY